MQRALNRHESASPNDRYEKQPQIPQLARRNGVLRAALRGIRISPETLRGIQALRAVLRRGRILRGSRTLRRIRALREIEILREI